MEDDAKKKPAAITKTVKTVKIKAYKQNVLVIHDLTAETTSSKWKS